MSRNRYYILFSIIGAGLILWQMLLPGYVLTLDMVFGPHFPIVIEGRFFTTLPIALVLAGAGHIMAGWVVQKIVLFALFFLLFYVPLRYLPVPRRWGSEYVAALFYSVNPFVYERFLAGHWMHLLAYALLPALVAALIDYWREQSWRNALRSFGWLFAIGMFSLHFLVMATLAIAGFFVIALLKRRSMTRFIGAGLLFAVVSTYWTLPALTGHVAPIEQFDVGHQVAFMTSADAHLGGAVGSVAALYGFWGEHEPWAGYFLWPKDHPVIFYPALAILAGLVVLGMYSLRHRRLLLLVLILIGVVAGTLSLGIANSSVRVFNEWLFAHVGFWGGFRDSQKWSGWLVLVYATLVGYGADWIVSRIKNTSVREYVLFVMAGVVILYAYPMVGGFARQLQPVQYPKSWNTANEVFKQDPQCKAIFLPWHQYFSLGWNHNLITVAPASRYFDCDIISSENMEVGGVRRSPSDVEHATIDDIITAGERQSIDGTIGALARQGIHYIVFSPTDLGVKDGYMYPWLTSERLLKVLDGSDLQLLDIHDIIMPVAN
jgi:hypothetical protein